MTKVFVVHGESGESENSKLILPVSGAEYIGIFNTSLSKIKNNFSPFKRSGGIVGNVAVDLKSATFKSLSSYINTGVEDSDDFTTFIVAKTESVVTSTQSAPVFISNFETPPKDGHSATPIQGVCLYVDQNNYLSLAACRGDNISNREASLVPLLQKFDANEYQLCIAQVSMMNSKLWNRTKKMYRNLLFEKPRLLAAGKLRIGSSYTSFEGVSNIALAIHYSRALSDSDIVKVEEWIREYMLSRSIRI